MRLRFREFGFFRIPGIIYIYCPMETPEFSKTLK